MKTTTSIQQTIDPSRKVGLELEFAGLQLNQTAQIVRDTYGGEVIEKHRYHFDVADTEFGVFRVELDARILRKMAGQDFLRKFGIESEDQKIRASIEEVLDRVAKTVVPIEVVMPPVRVNELPEMERLREQLQLNKAEGTKSSLVHAFGMHINIEAPDLEPKTLLNYLRAFILVYPWLLRELKIDISRRISPFVDPFPDAYAEKVLDTLYRRDLKQMIADYLEFNATRNRPLDMMPIFAMIDEPRINEALKGEKNAPRPAFHYRLPNSRINDPEWSFMEEWDYWLKVEKLADNPDMIEKLSRLYLLRKGSTLVSFKKEWAETITILLDLDE